LSLEGSTRKPAPDQQAQQAAHTPSPQQTTNNAMMSKTERLVITMLQRFSL